MHRKVVVWWAAVAAAGCVRPAPPRIEVVPAIGPAAADSAPRTTSPDTPDVLPAGAPAGAPAGPASTTADPPTALGTAAREVAPAAPSDSDVHRRARELFGDSLVAPAPDSAAEPSWDIDVRSYESTDRVEHYVELFTGPARDRVCARLSRGTRYESMIRGAMKAGGLPEDLYYLALIESGYDPNAYSRAAAVGMWQFMTSTARDMGMRVDWWVDERRDPVKSTLAAVRFIKDLDDQFGSLYLAAAAYNGGPGRIQRGLTRYADDLEGTSGDDLFFALADKSYLRNETREYVPQLIAAALIAKEPARYGVRFDSEPAFAYDSVRVGPDVALAAVAAASDTTVDAILELNPQILRGVTPPRDSVVLRIPRGSAAAFDSALAALPRGERVGLATVESKKGESVARIARRYDLTAKELDLYNPTLRRLKSGNLVAGQRVLVPTRAVAAAATAAPDPGIERYGSSGKTVGTHVVKSGETLSGIAKRYHTTVKALMRANGLHRALILPGQSLVIRRAK